jgi:hypothetical protein
MVTLETLPDCSTTVCSPYLANIVCYFLSASLSHNVCDAPVWYDYSKAEKFCQHAPAKTAGITIVNAAEKLVIKQRTHLVKDFLMTVY